jgi:hypothetical protein
MMMLKKPCGASFLPPLDYLLELVNDERNSLWKIFVRKVMQNL